MSTYNLGTLRGRVQDKLDNPLFSPSIINQFLNDGLRDVVIQAKPQHYRAEAVFTTTVGASTLTTTATDMLVPLSMRLYTPINYAMVLPYIEYEDVDVAFPNFGLTGNGPPIAWSTFALVPFVVNNADAVYTLRGKYLTIPAELVLDTDVPLLPVTFSEILVLAAYKRALEHDDDFDEAQVIQQEITSKLMDMTTFLRPQMGTPHIMRQNRTRRRLGVR